MLQEFLAAQEEKPKEARTAILPHWRLPDADVIKINFDAAVFKVTNTTGIGVIAWNWCGEAIRAVAMPIPLSTSVADLEALACRRAVLFAAELGLHRVIFEGDSALIINAISQGSAALSSYVNIVEDIRGLLSGFQTSDVMHVHRS